MLVIAVVDTIEDSSSVDSASVCFVSKDSLLERAAIAVSEMFASGRLDVAEFPQPFRVKPIKSVVII